MARDRLVRLPNGNFIKHSRIQKIEISFITFDNYCVTIIADALTVYKKDMIKTREEALNHAIDFANDITDDNECTLKDLVSGRYHD